MYLSTVLLKDERGWTMSRSITSFFLTAYVFLADLGYAQAFKEMTTTTANGIVSLSNQNFNGANVRFAEDMTNIGDINDDGNDDIALFMGRKQSYNCSKGIACNEAYYPGIIIVMPNSDGTIPLTGIFTIDASSIAKSSNLGTTPTNLSLKELFNRGSVFPYFQAPFIRKIAQDQSSFTIQVALNKTITTLKIGKEGGFISGNVYPFSDKLIGPTEITNLVGLPNANINFKVGAQIGLETVSSVDEDSYDDIMVIGYRDPTEPLSLSDSYNGYILMQNYYFLRRNNTETFNLPVRISAKKLFPLAEDLYNKTADPTIGDFLYNTSIVNGYKYSETGNDIDNLGDLDHDNSDEIFISPFVFSFSRTLGTDGNPDIKALRCIRFEGDTKCYTDYRTGSKSFKKLGDLNSDGYEEVATISNSIFETNEAVIYTAKISQDNFFIDLIPYKKYSVATNTLPAELDEPKELLVDFDVWNGKFIALSLNNYSPNDVSTNIPSKSAANNQSVRFQNRLWIFNQNTGNISSQGSSSSSRNTSSSSISTSSSSSQSEVMYTDRVMSVDDIDDGKELKWFQRQDFNPNSIVSPNASGNVLYLFAHESWNHIGKTYLNNKLPSVNSEFQLSIAIENSGLLNCVDSYCGNIQVFFDGRGLAMYQVGQIELTNMEFDKVYTLKFGLGKFVRDLLATQGPYPNGELKIILKSDNANVNTFVGPFQFNYDRSIAVRESQKIDCSTTPRWSKMNLASYNEGIQIREDLFKFECLAFPASGWCKSDAYRPLVNLNGDSPLEFQIWQQAWKQLGKCQ
jgi:hypothetical protein